MSWIDGLLERTTNALRFKGVGIQSALPTRRLLTTGSTEIDSFFVSKISAASYFVQAESEQGITESLYVNIAVNMTPDRANYLANMSVFGRVSTGVQLIDISATVDRGQVSLQASVSAGATGNIQVRLFPTYMEAIYGN